MLVIKRNGEKVPYERDKITKAVNKAIYEVDGEMNELVSNRILENIEEVFEDLGITETSVESIQDMVEEGLMDIRPDVAKAYIRYRYKRELAREEYKSLMADVAEKLNATDVQNQNANVDEHSFGGRMGEMNAVVSKRYALQYLISPMARDNHLNNEIYIHDLDNYAVGSHNCLTIPFDDLLAKGFNTRQTDVRPAQSVSTAFQLEAVIFQLQSLNQFGGVSASHIDWTMVPYVRKSFAKHYRVGCNYFMDLPEHEGLDYSIENLIQNATEYSITEDDWKSYCSKAYDYAIEMTEKEVYQAVEAMYHNLNTLQSRSGNQLPFTSINYGTCTLPEGRMVTKAILEGSIKGIGALHKTSVFPCGIFQCMKGVNRKPGDPNYDLFQLALKSTAQRLYPNYVNVDWSVNEGYDRNDPRTYVSTMGCRTYNGFDINGLGMMKDGRGNICPVTIIMPTLAMEAKELSMNKNDDNIVENFIEILDKKIFEARDMLLERFEWICSQNPASARFMYENGLMAGYVPEEGIRSALKHGTLAIGQLGLAETLQILIGCDHTEERGMELAKRIEQLFNDRCKQFKNELKLNFGVYYTPKQHWESQE